MIKSIHFRKIFKNVLRKIFRIIIKLSSSLIISVGKLILYPQRHFRINRFYRFKYSVNHILIIYMAEGLGDCILFSGALPAIREKFKQVKIDLLIFQRFKEYLEKNPYIDQLFAYPDYRYSKHGLRGFLVYSQYIKKHCRPDVLIDLLPNRFIKPAIFSWFISKKLSIGFDYLIKKIFYDIAIKIDWDKYIYDVMFDALKPLGIGWREPQYWVPTNSLDFDIPIQKDFQEKTIVLAPGGSFNFLKPRGYGGFRYYPQLLSRLIDNGYRVVLVGAEFDMNSHFFEGLPKDRFINLLGKTSITQLFSLVKNYADIVVCNTSGLLYVALVLGVPAVFYAHPLENLKRWHPAPNDERYQVLQDKAGGAVTIDDFLNAIEKVINQQKDKLTPN